jgi:hypothetical protein
MSLPIIHTQCCNCIVKVRCYLMLPSALCCCRMPCCGLACRADCRAVTKGSSNAMKAAGLKLAAAVVEGLPRTDRNMTAVQAEAWKLYEKQVKVCKSCPCITWVTHKLLVSCASPACSCICLCQ